MCLFSKSVLAIKRDHDDLIKRISRERDIL